MKNLPLLQIQDLSISFRHDKTFTEVIHQISFEVFPNQIVGIVGESGSGKSVTSLAILGLLPKKNSQINHGSIHFNGIDLSSLTPSELRKLRGNEIAMIFQEPMSSLNPSMKCGTQVLEILLEHTDISNETAKQEVLSLFEKVKLPDIHRAYNAYPHELSGGQKQRIMIAMAISCKPSLLIADEPTTALDVTVQKEIIALLKALQTEQEMSILFISHDLSLVSEIADEVVVMYKGNIVEQNTAKAIFSSPKEQYTKALINARPSLEVRLKRLPTISDFIKNTDWHGEVITNTQRNEMHQQLYNQTPLLEVRDVSKSYFSPIGWFGSKEFKAVNQVSFQLYEGETLGLVGESGCGKSTLGNVILQLDQASSGHIFYKGNDLTQLPASELRTLRKEIQLIFQDPFASLNPKMTIGKAIMEPMIVHKLYNSTKERKQKTLELLTRVGLEASHFDRYPHEFSGGQRQRIGIARTIALRPKLIICDESVSALDISVQAQVLNLLNELKEDFGFTYIFISHDLAVVKYMADQLLVMNQGQIEEFGEADAIYKNPKSDYTQNLIASIPKGL